jgi:hypothetical protein
VWNRVALNQAITDTSTTQLHDLGEEVMCKDVGSTARGFGVFKYLKGVASTAQYDCVVFDSSDHTTTRTVAATIGDVGIAQSANVASAYGWYQVIGCSPVTAGTVLDNGLVYTTATDGSLDDTQVDSQQILNAQFRAATDTGLALIQLNRAHAGTDDQVT